MSLVMVSRVVYLVAAVLFVLGLKKLSHPGTARVGNLWAAVGMGLAILVSLLTPGLGYGWLLAGMGVGSAIGWLMAARVQMTEMPQMVALLNGFGGLGSMMVGLGDYWHRAVVRGEVVSGDDLLTIGLSVLIGAVTFSGSLVAFGKLQGLVDSAPVSWPGKFVTSGGVALVAVGSVGWLVVAPPSLLPLGVMSVFSLALGVMLVLPIGGADMPVVIALLNSYSGMAASATGFVLGNELLIAAGALVGASGIILTRIMCEAMNRSLTNVVFGAFGSGETTEAAAAGGEQPMRAVSVDDVAISLAYAEKVVIVPGYGMATAQAQHVVRELGELLERKGVAVRYAIHPVAGRMPGHMNVLLAEANVPYSALFELEQIADDLQSTDVAVVIGANDVVNPDARDNPKSAIYGMPILEVDRCRSVVVLKRGRGKGFAGIENPLFFNPKTGMLFGDAKESLTGLVQAVKAL